jgi:hypothetical protein
MVSVDFKKFFRESVDLFLSVEPKDEALRKALVAYIRLGKAVGMSQGEQIDFLGISSPSILDCAGYDDTRQEQVMDILGNLSDMEIQ